VGANSDLTRIEILQAARRVITTYGYGSATFQAIAKEAGLSRPTLHYYFANREDIYHQLVDEAYSIIADCAAEALERSGPVNRIAAFLHAVHATATADRSATAFIVIARLEAHRFPELDNAVTDEVRAFLTRVLSDAAAAGELRSDTDVASVVDMLDAVLWGMGFHTGFIGGEGSLSSIARQLHRMLTGALLSSPVGSS
jgi:AcrR family transcriptional regulator